MIADPITRRDGTIVLGYDTSAGRTEATFVMPDGVTIDDGPDASVAAGWLPAMARREPLIIGEPISARLAAHTGQIADIMLSWDRALHPDDPRYGRVPLQAPVRSIATTPRSTRTACFFTGGVDSFYSVVQHHAEIDTLVFVHGFDLLDDRTDALNRDVSERLHEAARMLERPLLEVECNLVAFSQASGIGWDDYHGAALATVALLLAPAFSRWYVPATSTYANLYPLGSHPLLDPLWATEQIEIIHDGADATRVEKLRALAEVPAARAHLRVCFENRDARYNCGECEKCVRTGVAVRIAGVEGTFATLPGPSLRQVADVRIVGLGSTWIGYRDELRRSRANERLRWAIELALARHRIRVLSDRLRPPS